MRKREMQIYSLLEFRILHAIYFSTSNSNRPVWTHGSHNIVNHIKNNYIVNIVKYLKILNKNYQH